MVHNKDNAGQVIRVKDLSFRYKAQKEKKALDGINLTVNKGQFVVIMGPSGAGKSTLANCLNGLIPNFIKGKYEGQVEVMGKNPAKEKVGAMSKEIGLVFQDFESQLFSTNTKLEIVFGPENFNVPREEMEEIIARIIKVVNLEGLENRQPATLSGGQKQRLAIGSVLAIQPKIVCMDEPTTDLDPLGKLGIFQIAKALHQDKDFTLLIIEHETEEALEADRILVMDKGQIAKDGSPEEILREVDYFDSIGIMPLQVPKYFHSLGVPQNELPLTPDEGLKKWSQMGLAIAEDRYASLLEQDKAREQNYGEVILAVKDLEHMYGNGNKVLHGIDLEIRKGEFLAVLGHNGSGKTTLVKHFNGLLLPTGGQVVVKGKDTKKHSIFEIGKDVGYVFQNPDHQIFSDTVFEEVAFSPKMRGCSKEEIEQRVKEALKAVDMEGYENEDPFSLTKGERQRIAVASVLSAQPDIIILDEPTTGLDYKEQRRMMELVKKLNENGHTIIIVTHTMWVVAEYAHKVAVIKDGYMSMYGRTREVFGREEDLLASYLKTPHVVSLSNMLGRTVLSVEELLYCTARS
ncbi:ABC transporter ATP-binding protein [Zhaonella formicivorans]|uniref:ABC transporter ATP-binding protein n=1 Tax=Zhaonella formicivorans TaxID=2528593 RepID=UPI0010DA3117|nr:ABC transporter ATP-binding protein [Zhaonella formicivorans]